jgi:hypothetical protein
MSTDAHNQIDLFRPFILFRFLKSVRGGAASNPLKYVKKKQIQQLGRMDDRQTATSYLAQKER